ncbi:uncharacterized protein LOC129774770 [Toxorhynchites rutilus septentrionalis]|uniref:uncharacterized protein LOC129774770 n=1 Tax=Toxorhynchites rutilus septentrionalis TaxID=329112 RepID=UPI0024796674|nr:uncharacterized protein LOC129774770 [Toxorhynchites rutilus septentrionalis]
MMSIVYLLALLLILQIRHSNAETYKCTVESNGPKSEEYCVFRNVQFFRNTTEISFSSPDGVAQPNRIVFLNSTMVHIPREFIEVFGSELTVLKVEQCQLRSVTITAKMVALYARNNYIDKVIVHQSGANPVLEELDLSANRLENVQNITRFQKLKLVNLSSNQNLVDSMTLDFSLFHKLDDLRELYLSDVGAFYLQNTKDTKLRSLEVLDLSRNTILSVDLQINIFYAFEKLHTLKLNDNDMDQIGYPQLLELKSLKTIYLNGNSFPCRYLEVMLKYLHENNIATPSERHSNCQSHLQEVDGMCCKYTTPIPVTPYTPKPGDTSQPGTTERSDLEPHSEQMPPADGDGGSGLTWGISIVVVLILIAAAAVGFVVYRKRSRS